MHMPALAWIDLNFCMVNERYVDILSLKFDIDLLWGCGEINVLLAMVAYPYVLHVFSSISKNLAPKSPRF